MHATASGSSPSITPWSTASSICASEAKALLPFLPAIETDLEALKDYLTFQFCLGGKTLFKAFDELLPGHTLTVRERSIVQYERYWEVRVRARLRSHGASGSRTRLRELVDESVAFHLRADVPVGAYLSGGLDFEHRRRSRSREPSATEFQAFTGRFDERRALRRERATPASSPRASEHFSCTKRRSPRTTSSSQHPRGHLPPRLPGRRPGLVPAVHGLAAGRAAHEGRARRPGRRRDLRRLRALPARVLRAVHQGRDRRDDARRAISSSPTNRSSRTSARFASTSR